MCVKVAAIKPETVNLLICSMHREKDRQFSLRPDGLLPCGSMLTHEFLDISISETGSRYYRQAIPQHNWSHKTQRITLV